MKHLISFMCFSMLFLFAACEPSNNVKPSEEPISIDLSNMDLSDLSFDFDLTSSFAFGLSDRESLDQLTDQLIEELFQDGKGDLSWFELDVTANQTYLLVGLANESGGEKKGGCGEEGWTTVDEDDGLCRNETCVRNRVVSAFDAAGEPGIGQCVDTRVHRRLTGVAVCWRIRK
jgi:hypothetical protein